MRTTVALLVSASVLATAAPALAQEKLGEPIAITDNLALDIIFDSRLRYETVSEDKALDTAEALTLRGRLGATLTSGGFQFLAEGEGTAVFFDEFNDTLPYNGTEPYSVVADPQNLELNRLQISYMKNGSGATVGRQRIILDNARFVGNVGWRQNEQTFDAVRAQAKLGPVKLDATYANSQRTIFGNSSPNEHFNGDLIFLNAGAKLGPVDLTGFSYTIDYDTRVAFSSQTFGGIARFSLPLPGVPLSATASYARQSEIGGAPVAYDADYFHGELGATVFGLKATVGYEELGSDDGVAAFQTPLATLHAFNGWADMFLVTPANGLVDYYAGIGRGLSIGGVGPLNFGVTYHEFDSDFGDIEYGNEWDAVIGTKFRGVGMLVKYASYQAESFGVDTEKLWLQLEYAF